MCQLSFANLKNEDINRMLLLSLFYENTKVQNRDGFGIFTGKYIAKSHIDARLINNFGTVLLGVTKLPVIGHVRNATAVNTVKTVDDETAHPFETDLLVLAHNGVVDFRDYKKGDEYKGEKVDSKIFLLELTKNYSKALAEGKNDFVAVLQETVKEFYGAFAFLIYNKVEKQYFAVRGNARTLHATKVTCEVNGEEISGIVINTNKEDLFLALLHAGAFLEISGKAKIKSWTPIVELKADTAFFIDLNNDELIEVGEVKEESRPKVVYPQAGSHRWDYDDSSNTYSGYNTGVIGDKKLAEKIYNYLVDLGLSPIELDYLLFVCKKKGFMESTSADIQDFISKTGRMFKPLYTKEKRNIWDKIKEYYRDPVEATYSLGLEFPYFMNSKEVLKATLVMLKKVEYGR